MSGFVGLALLAVAAGSAAIGAGRKVLERRRARRTLREQPPLSAAAPEGETVRVTGIVRVADETLVAPLSGLTCVVSRSQVSVGAKITSRAVRPRETVHMVPFLIDRGDEGIVHVEGKHALLDLPPLHRRDLDSERCIRLLVVHGYSRRDMRRAVFAETIVAAGDRVSLSGLVMKDVNEAPPGDEERGFREALPTTIRIAGNAEHPLAIGEPIDP